MPFLRAALLKKKAKHEEEEKLKPPVVAVESEAESEETETYEGFGAVVFNVFEGEHAEKIRKKGIIGWPCGKVVEKYPAICRVILKKQCADEKVLEALRELLP